MLTIQDVVTAAEYQRSYTKSIEQLEEQLKTAKEELRVLSQETLPNMMLELGLSSFKLADGSEVSIFDEVYAKLPAVPDKAFQWLREHNNDGIIKNQVFVNFSKGEDQKAQEILDLLAAEGVYAEQKSTIHHQTLKAFIKEMISKGVAIPMEEFGAQVVKTSVIRLPKS